MDQTASSLVSFDLHNPPALPESFWSPNITKCPHVTSQDTQCKNNSAVGCITARVVIYYFKHFQLNKHINNNNYLAITAASYRAQREFRAKCCAKTMHATWSRVLSNLGHSASFNLWVKHHTRELTYLQDRWMFSSVFIKFMLCGQCSQKWTVKWTKVWIWNTLRKLGRRSW